MYPRVTEKTVGFDGYGEKVTNQTNQQTSANVTGIINRSDDGCAVAAVDRALSKDNKVRSVNHDVSTGAFKKVSNGLTGWSWYLPTW